MADIRRFTWKEASGPVRISIVAIAFVVTVSVSCTLYEALVEGGRVGSVLLPLLALASMSAAWVFTVRWASGTSLLSGWLFFTTLALTFEGVSWAFETPGGRFLLLPVSCFLLVAIWTAVEWVWTSKAEKPADSGDVPS